MKLVIRLFGLILLFTVALSGCSQTSKKPPAETEPNNSFATAQSLAVNGTGELDPGNWITYTSQ